MGSTRTGSSLIWGADCIIRCTGFLSKSRFSRRGASSSQWLCTIPSCPNSYFSVSFHVPFSTFFSNQTALPLRWLLIPLWILQRAHSRWRRLLTFGYLSLLLVVIFVFLAVCVFSRFLGGVFSIDKKRIRRQK